MSLIRVRRPVRTSRTTKDENLDRRSSSEYERLPFHRLNSDSVFALLPLFKNSLLPGTLGPMRTVPRINVASRTYFWRDRTYSAKIGPNESTLDGGKKHERDRIGYLRSARDYCGFLRDVVDHSTLKYSAHYGTPRLGSK